MSTPSSETGFGQFATSRAIVVVVLISFTAVAFLVWLIYIHRAGDEFRTHATFLPGLNAALNGASALALLIGRTFIRTRRVAAHRAAMITAFVLSIFFLAGYILHHALHGEVRYPAHGALRTVYLTLLASHIMMAAVTLPVVLLTFFYSLSGKLQAHRKIARWSFPMWLYVSTTGVLTYAMLSLAQN